MLASLVLARSDASVRRSNGAPQHPPPPGLLSLRPTLRDPIVGHT
jgi:hypothetical protein